MKILMYGAGVIGCTYGWQLTHAGHELSVLVRKHKKPSLEKEGIVLSWTDYRGVTKTSGELVFRPQVIDSLSADNDYDYIIVSTGTLHLDEVLSVLKESSGRAHILFFQNLWYDDLEKIRTYLSPERYFLGFPFMAGGGRNEKGQIQAVLSGSRYSKTLLGEVSGEVSQRVLKLAEALDKAGMKAFVSPRIVHWLMPHYAFMAAISAGIMCAGGRLNLFVRNPAVVRETILAIREGFCICSAMGHNPKKEKVNQLYYFPLFISSPVVRKVFSDESMSAMFDLYLQSSADEAKKMADILQKYGDMHRLRMPYLEVLRNKVFQP